MRSRSFRWAVLAIILAAGCDSNPGGPAAPVFSSGGSQGSPDLAGPKSKKGKPQSAPRQIAD